MLPATVRPRLSVVLITHNEAANITACLQSVAFADEWVVVDNRSTDHTVALGKALGAKVIQTTDWPGFGPQKNRALAAATGEWVLSIDADERVSPQLAAEIQRVVADNQNRVYSFARQTQFCGVWIRHCGWTPDRVPRLFKRTQACFSPDWVHERLVSQQKVGQLKGLLYHYSYPSPEIYWQKLQRYSMAWAKQSFEKGKTTSMGRAWLAGLFAFVKSYIFRLGFLDGPMGLAVCSLQAQAAFGKYFYLYCLRQSAKLQPNQSTLNTAGK